MASGNWKMVTPPAEFLELWQTKDNIARGVKPPLWYENPNGLTALVGREPVDLLGDDWRWHISVRYGNPGNNGRIPTWDELVSTAHELRPGVVFVIGIPPRSWWMNIHPHVLHLMETTDLHLIESWRDQGQGDTPS